MSLPCLKSNRGLTLAELTVALAITSILLVGMVSASLFVGRYISNRQKKDTLAEELAFVSQELSGQLASARTVTVFKDSLRLLSGDRTATTYVWRGGRLLKNGRNLTRSNLRIDSLSIRRIALPKEADLTTLQGTDYAETEGLYELFIGITSAQKISASLKVVVKNEYEFRKYANK
jgi:prepilin-type N-terminal cleavage/methylation domain-containing protein